jgi:uncharacterized protein (TIGR02421 family)
MPNPTQSLSAHEPKGSPQVRREEYARVLEAASEKLRRDEYVRRRLPGSGRVHIDRRVPFLALYRSDPEAEDPGTEQLVTTQASYMLGSRGKADRTNVKRFVKGICELLADSFGSVLLLEVWSRPETHPPVRTSEESLPLPAFRLFHPRTQQYLDPLMQLLVRELSRKQIIGPVPAVEIVQDPRDFAERVQPVFATADAEKIPCIQLGVEVEPVYRMPGGEGIYPELLRALRTRFGRALKHLFFEFARKYTSHRPRSFHSLGRRAVVKSVWAVDSQLDEISSSFDLLIESSPTNTEALWTAFRKSGFERLPRLRYRPMPLDPAITKRRLFAIPIERIEDPTIGHLFREKQAELDRQLTMLGDRGTSRFLLGSLQLYGDVSSSLLRSAEEILERVPAPGSGGESGHGLKAEEFKERADAELAYYRRQWDGFAATSRFSDAVIGGLMVSRGHLLMARGMRTPASRVDALLQHEVGTHLVTYYNGVAQRLTQLRTGFAGYDELQEGLAVIAEYFVGGMTPARLRVLAARVVGARMLIDGAGPVDTFRLLCRYGFAPLPAFNVMLRLYRGGGLVKDAIYLRGLITILDYIRDGGDLEPLFVGKIAAEHIPLVHELRRRGIVTPPKLTPRYLERPESRERLERLRAGVSVVDLLE